MDKDVDMNELMEQLSRLGSKMTADEMFHHDLSVVLEKHLSQWFDTEARWGSDSSEVVVRDGNKSVTLTVGVDKIVIESAVIRVGDPDMLDKVLRETRSTIK